MPSKIAAWGIRFAVFAALFLAVVLIWLDRTTGWEGLSLFGASIMFGGIAAASWWLAVVIEQYLVNARLRFAAHPVLVSLTFVAIAQLVVVGYFDTPFELLWRDAEPFVVLVAATAAADALVGFLLDRGVSSRRPEPMA
ncbi:MAG: hypothetical protein ACREDY_08620 [Bradyrhizobium sp.]